MAVDGRFLSHTAISSGPPSQATPAIKAAKANPAKPTYNGFKNLPKPVAGGNRAGKGANAKTRSNEEITNNKPEYLNISYLIGNHMTEIPSFALRAYALFLLRHGTAEDFNQQDLAWIVSEPMRKKIFSVLLRAGWIGKTGRATYRCIEPKIVFRNMLQFRVPDIMKMAKKPFKNNKNLTQVLLN